MEAVMKAIDLKVGDLIGIGQGHLWTIEDYAPGESLKMIPEKFKVRRMTLSGKWMIRVGHGWYFKGTLRRSTEIVQMDLADLIKGGEITLVRFGHRSRENVNGHAANWIEQTTSSRYERMR